MLAACSWRWCPLAGKLDSLAIVAVVTALLAGLIVLETRTYGPTRIQVRHDYYVEGAEGVDIP